MAIVTLTKKGIIAGASPKANSGTTKTNNGNGGVNTNNGNSNNLGGSLNMTLVNKLKAVDPGKIVPTNGRLQPLYLNTGDNGLPAMFRANMDNTESFSYEGAHIVRGTTMPTFVRVDVNNESLTHVITPFKDGDVI